MTAKDLNQLKYLKSEIKTEEERVEELKSVSTRTSTRITGMPKFTSSYSNKPSIMDKVIVLEDDIQQHYEKCLEEYKRLNDFIYSCEDSYVRQIMIFRFIQDLSWVQVSIKMGGGNTEDGVRATLKRYLKKINGGK